MWTPSPQAHLEGKSSLLCLASAMSPPLVQFSWKRQKEDGSLEELTRDDGEQLVLTEPGRTAAILLIHQPENSTYKYSCYVKHEGAICLSLCLRSPVNSIKAFLLFKFSASESCFESRPDSFIL
uniref:Ig-like domain-containing protein n=1 Tax=Seriola dumerili TaxID=41447 RepID=A0A3B4U4W5_SERDU